MNANLIALTETAVDEPALRLLPAPRKRILLADDSPQIRESLGRLLRRAGYDVSFASHGGHVLDQVLNEPVDLLLLDLNMPQIDGWDVLDQLHALKRGLPIIVITAQPNQKEWVTSGGAHALMEKPLDLPVLLQTIEDFLKEPPEPEGANEDRKPFRHGWPRRVSSPRGGINE
jgi:CheY-like chemotaxis protein